MLTNVYSTSGLYLVQHKGRQQQMPSMMSMPSLFGSWFFFFFFLSFLCLFVVESQDARCANRELDGSRISFRLIQEVSNIPEESLSLSLSLCLDKQNGKSCCSSWRVQGANSSSFLYFIKKIQQQFKPKREPGVKCDDKNLLLHIHHHQPGNLAVASASIQLGYT